MNMIKKTLSFLLYIVIIFSLGTYAFAAKYSSSDARHALRMASGLEAVDKKYDVDSDGAVSANDARILLRRAARLADVSIVTTSEPTTEKAFYQNGVLSTCGLSESQLSNGLKKTLKKYARAFLEAEQTYNVNAVFLSAVAALESGWGESSIARNRNNLFGWTGSSGYRYFDSVPECIMYVAKHLRSNYLTPGGSCFRGYEVEDISKCYCPGGNWASSVRSIMRMIQSQAKGN